VNHESDGRARQGRVMLHRAVMSVVLGRQLGRDEFVCHRDDDPRNNWPDNLYLGDHSSNAADSLRNGDVCGETTTRVRRFWMLRSARSVRPCLGVSGWGTSLVSTVCTRARSAGSSMACAAGYANRAEHDRRVIPPGPIATDPSLRSPLAPSSVPHSQGSAVPPPGFLNTDWRSGIADSNP
jgi:hypothetical protein